MLAHAPRIARRALFALAFAPLLTLQGPPAQAEEVTCDGTTDFPCSYQLKDLQLQKVPSVFKFQARVSQAKLPLGEGVFNTVYVKLLRGTEVKCIEQFQNVQVVDSVLNLEIGRNMSCEMDEVIAENTDLAFQICPGGAENCLQPVSLGAAPYAIKASFASIAQEAHHASFAGQASYAHRVTADRDLLIRSRLGTGYFDFFTPTYEQAVELYGDAAAFQDFENSGFVQWTPVRDRDALDLHICAKRQDGDRLTELRSLHLASEDTTATGDLTVTPSPGGKGLTVTLQGAHVTGDSNIDGTLLVTLATTVASGGIHVTGNSDVAGELLIAKKTTVQEGGVHVTGHSDVTGPLTGSQGTTVHPGGVHVTGDSDIAGALDVWQALTVLAGGAHVTGASEIDGTLAVGGALSVAAGGAQITGNTSVAGTLSASQRLTVATGGFDVTGDSRVAGRLDAQDVRVSGSIAVLDALNTPHRAFAISGVELGINPDATLQSTRVKGPVRFDGPVIFDGGTTDPSAVAAFVLSQGETRDLIFGGKLTAIGVAAFPAGITGALAVNGAVSASGSLTIQGPATFNGPVSLAGGVTGNVSVGGNLAAAGSLQVGGPSTFTGAISAPGGVAGNLGVTGALSVTSNAAVGGTLGVAGATTFAGPATFNGAVALPGGVQGTAAVTGDLQAGGDTSLAGTLEVAGASRLGAIDVLGAALFEGTASFMGGVVGNVTFSNNVVINGTTTLVGNANVGGNLTIDGTTRFNGPVNFGGSFTGTTQFQNASVSGSLSVGGTTIFSGPVALTGGITGDVSVGSLTATTALIANNSATFKGPVDFQGAVTGLDLVQYVKASGETRAITLPGLVVTGAATFQTAPTFPNGIGSLSVGTLSVSGTTTLGGATTINGNLVVNGTFRANCRICLNYADSNGTSESSRKHACVRLEHGAFSGNLNLSGDVDDNDVVALKFLCDNGGNESGAGWL